LEKILIMRGLYLCSKNVLFTLIFFCAVAPTLAQSGDEFYRDDWKPLFQPDLGEKISSAESIVFKELSPPPQKCWHGHKPYLVPNPESDSWDMIMPYYNQYMGSGEAIIYDFGSKEMTRQVWGDNLGDKLSDYYMDFHLKLSYYVDNKLVFYVWANGLNLSGRPVMILVYDPAVNGFTYAEHPTPQGSADYVRGATFDMTEEGMVYGVGWDDQKNGYIPVSYNPVDNELRTFEKMAPYEGGFNIIYRKSQAIGDWIYAAIGNNPWRLVAFNFRLGEGKVLAETEQITGDFHTIILEEVRSEGDKGIRGHIRQARWIDGLGDVNREQYDFWLYNGAIYSRENQIAPWSGTTVEKAGSPFFSWQREGQQWPEDFNPPSNIPIIKRDSANPDAYGNVNLPFYIEGEYAEKTLKYKVKMYDGIVRRIKEINDSILGATDEGYGQTVFYELNSDTNHRIDGILSPYSMAVDRKSSKLYISGYPNSRMLAYNVNRPLGHKLVPPNPEDIGLIGRHSDVHYPLGTEIGADGRIYNAGTTTGRTRYGGGFGWYDPKTGMIDGFYKPYFEDYKVFWTASAKKGRYILLSTKPAGASPGKLFCWDTRKHEMIYSFKPPGAFTTGPIVEVFPGLMMGYTLTEDEKGLLYGFEAKTGEILWEKEVPNPPITAFSKVRRHAYSFRQGPDDHIWAFIGDVLVRIDPRNIEVKVVGETDPAQLAFAQGNVYIAGGSMLRQLEGVHPKDTIAPWAPVDLTGSAGQGKINLAWAENMEQDLEGYHIYRSLDSLGKYTRINDELVKDTAFRDTDLEDNTIYYYKVTAVDDAGNESGPSGILSTEYIGTGLDPGGARSDPQVQVYPNPSDGQITLEMEGPDQGYLEVFSILGKKILGKTLTRRREQINLSENRPGIYLFRIHVNAKTVVRRVVIK